MASVTLTSLRKAYAGNAVIHGIDCSIADGEFIVIVGPSGCGKSTLLRMIAGLETVTSGELRIGDRVVNNVEPKDRDIAMVFQNYALYPHMSVYANMAYGLRIRKIADDEIRTRVDKAAAILQLGAVLERKPNQLSGGQRQRVAMGRAIVRYPQVFLFDEPLSNLDAQLRVQLRVEIKQLQQQLGTTSIYVTHDQVEAMTLADRLIVLKDGFAEQIGGPIDLYERPATQFVASFIGSPSMNFLAATGNDEPKVTLEGGLEIPVGQHVSAGATVTLGIRPEHVMTVSAGEAQTTLTVKLVERLGADSIVHGHLPNGAAFLLRQPGVSTLAIGATLPIAFPAMDIHLFDKTTGRRI